MAIWRRTEKAMMRAMCGVKLIKKRRSQKLMSLLGLKDTLDGLVQRYDYILRRDNGNVLRRVFDFKVMGRRVCGQLNIM